MTCGVEDTSATSSGRRSFVREPGETRRAALIEATLDCIADGGAEAATVRAIAARAGVTQGLIRHYFSTKEELIGAAFAALMTRLTEDSARRLADGGADPVARLSAFVSGALSPPVIDGRDMALWAAFMQITHRDAALRAVHENSYLAFRDRLETLINDALTVAGHPAPASTLRRHAIACNAVIDGLWLEGSALPDAFAPGELAAIGRASVGALLRLDLNAPTAGETP